MATAVGTYYRATILANCDKCKKEVEDYVMYDDEGTLCLDCAKPQDVSE